MEEWNKYLNNVSVQKKRIAEFFVARMYGSVYEIAAETKMPVKVAQSLLERFKDLGMIYISSFRLSKNGMTPVYGRGNKEDAKLLRQKGESDVRK